MTRNLEKFSFRSALPFWCSVGLIPLMTNNDPETFMFIPMAISLAFGVLFATVITLLLVPSLYLMLDDLLIQVNKTMTWIFGQDLFEEEPETATIAMPEPEAKGLS